MARHTKNTVDLERPHGILSRRNLPVIAIGGLMLVSLSQPVGAAEPPPAQADLLFDENGEPYTADSNAPLQQATQFIELNARIEIESWPTIAGSARDVRCVIGTNQWLIAGAFFQDRHEVARFTGTNIVSETRTPPAGFQSTRRGEGGVEYRYEDAGGVLRQVSASHPSADGNPLRPRGQADVLLSIHAKVAWLAFCSGPAVRDHHSRLYPVSGLWKQVMPESEFLTRASWLENGFTMAKQIYLLTPEGQLALEYQVVDRTNILGWDFPLEFSLAQYRELRLPGEGVATNRWQLDFLARGKITSVAPAQFSPSEEAANRAQSFHNLLIGQPEWKLAHRAVKAKVIEEEGELSVLAGGYYSPLFHIGRMWGVVVSTKFPEYKNGEHRLLTVSDTGNVLTYARPVRAAE
jgi:hypothetical protein